MKQRNIIFFGVVMLLSMLVGCTLDQHPENASGNQGTGYQVDMREHGLRKAYQPLNNLTQGTNPDDDIREDETNK